MTEEIKYSDIYQVLPIELKMRTEDKQILDRIYADNARLISFLQWHYNRNYGRLINRNFGFDSCTKKDPCTAKEQKCEYHGVIIPFIMNASIDMSSELVRGQIDKVLETLKGGYSKRSKTEFSNIKNILRVRITNKNLTKDRRIPDKARHRMMTLKEEKGIIFATISLGRKEKLKAYVAYDESFSDKLRYQQLINALNGIDGYGVGDPSELQKVDNGRYVLHLAIKRSVRRIETHTEKTVVMGVNLNVVKFIAAAAINDETISSSNNNIDGILDQKAVFVDANDIVNRIFKEQHFQSMKRRRIQSGKKPLLAGEKSDVYIARRTRLDRSWLKNQYLQLTYRCVNSIIQAAIQNNVKVIKIENDRDLKYKKQLYSKERKYWGRLWMLSARKNHKAYGNYKMYLRFTKILNMFQYGQFKNDIIAEAAKHGIEIRVISPYQSSIKCSKCGYVDSKNLETIKRFKCLVCRYTTEADYNTARNNSRL